MWSKIIFHLVYKNIHEFEWYQTDLLKWTGKTLKRIEIWQKNTCGKAAVLEMLQGAIIFQIFPCIRKLVLQENFLRHIQKYVFFVWCNRIEAVSERYSLSLVFFTYVPHHSKLAPEFLSSHPRQAKKKISFP